MDKNLEKRIEWLEFLASHNSTNYRCECGFVFEHIEKVERPMNDYCRNCDKTLVQLFNQKTA